MDENYNKWGIFIFFGKKLGCYLFRLIIIKIICFLLEEKICNLYCIVMFGVF